MITLNKELSGNILDIGGGGEGIIGRLYGCQVTAIDNRQEELDEAPEGFLKRLMDATCLQFSENTFDYATFFYTLMFMDEETQRKAIQEAFRVIKNGGELYIWDCGIVSAYPEPFCISLEICLPQEHISTTYGVGKLGGQSCESIKVLCLDAGLSLLAQRVSDDGFYLRFVKRQN